MRLQRGLFLISKAALANKVILRKNLISVFKTAKNYFKALHLFVFCHPATIITQPDGGIST